MASQAVLRAAKNELRSLIKTKISEISPGSIEVQTATVFKTIIQQSFYTEAKNIGIYLSMPDREIGTDQIVRHALAMGKKVFVPYLHKNEDGPQELVRVMDMVDLGSLEDYESLSRDKWGIPSLNSEQVVGRERILGAQAAISHQHTPLDLILMPGVAFGLDEERRRIRRLGHGKGFYDFFLDRYHRSIQAQHTQHYPFLCGLALKEQILKVKADQQIPVGPLDKFLDCMVVGDGKVVGEVLAEDRNIASMVAMNGSE